MALAVYSLKTIVDAGIYAFDLIKSANLLEALKQESAASHIIIFLTQVGLTFLILGAIWRWFYLRQFRRFESTFAQTEARMEGILKRAQDGVIDFERKVQAFEQREDRLADRITSVRQKQDELLAKYNTKSDPPE